MTNVLIVEDSHEIAETLADYLELSGFNIDCAYNGEAALSLLQTQLFDVIIMDVMMPKLDGLSAVKVIRQHMNLGTPILFLTAKGELTDKIAGFEAGGDDYLVKPFALEELVLRVRALAVRGARQDVGTLSFADLTLDLQTEQVTREQQVLKLSRIQLQILKLLLQKAPAMLSRQEVLDKIWGEDVPPSDALRSHIYGLRNALEKGFDSPRLETIHGQGYRLRADD